MVHFCAHVKITKSLLQDKNLIRCTALVRIKLLLTPLWDGHFRFGVHLHRRVNCNNKYLLHCFSQTLTKCSNFEKSSREGGFSLFSRKIFFHILKWEEKTHAVRSPKKEEMRILYKYLGFKQMNERCNCLPFPPFHIFFVDLY